VDPSAKYSVLPNMLMGFQAQGAGFSIQPSGLYLVEAATGKLLLANSLPWALHLALLCSRWPPAPGG